jgi:carbon storage regulator
MLVLSRKPKESIIINGNITVSVLRIDSDNVRIGIEAPMEIPVMRQEIYNEISQNNHAAAGLAKAKVKLKVKELVKS